MPDCECHGEPMYRNLDKRCSKGFFWVCSAKHKEWGRRRYADSVEVRLDRQLRNMCRIR